MRLCCLSPLLFLAAISLSFRPVAAETADENSCSYLLSSNSFNVISDETSFTVSVTTGDGCAWNWTAGDFFGVSGYPTGTKVGSGSITFGVAYSHTIASRTGTATVANQTITVNQPGIVGSLWIPPNTVAGIGPGTGSFEVSTNATDIPWTASSTTPWITIKTPSGVGTGHLVFQNTINLGTAGRTGIIMVNGHRCVVWQEGPRGIDIVTMSGAAGATFPGSGGSGSISLTASSPGFSWFVFSDVDWITLTSGTAYTDSAQVTYQVAPNTSAADRYSNLSLNGGNLYSIYQRGNGTLTVSPPSVTMSAAGGSGTFTISTSDPQVYWQIWPSPYVPWVTTSYGSGYGSVQVNYQLWPNTSTNPRTVNLTIADKIFTITQAGTVAAPSPLRFVAVAPCRVLDTRLAAGPFGGPRIAAGGQRDFAIPQSGCSIPATAQAYSVNMTVVPKTMLSYLTAWPTGSPQPNVSTLNSLDGRIAANAAIIPAGTNGSVSVFATDDTDVVMDINGYFAPPSELVTLQFYPGGPCRVVDTRLEAGSFGGPSLAAGSSRSFMLPLSPCSIPAVSAAYSLNITAVPRGRLSYLTVWPAGQLQPFVSTLNAPNGGIVANAAIVPAGANGAINVYATDDTDVVIDINGYFSPLGNTGLQFYPVTPCRIMDTRLAAGPLGGPSLVPSTARDVPVTQSACNVSTLSQAYSMNATVVPSGGLGYLTLWPAGRTQPLVSTLNSPNGAIVANAAIVPAGNGGNISVFATDATHLVLDINGYFAP
jgi:hypothetical protein